MLWLWRWGQPPPLGFLVKDPHFFDGPAES